jgi:hypothetical protein
VSEASDTIEIDPAAFLKWTCERLAEVVEIDQGVAAVLTTMLTSDAGPAAGVLTAREALRKLATTRATPGCYEAEPS